MIRILGTVLAALVGLAFGSFLNVCLSRWPAGESVVRPRSHCRSCNRTLAWWENIPLLSWIALRGHCRTCDAQISGRYPLGELALGVAWGTVAWQTIGQVVHSIPGDSAPLPISFSPRFLILTILTVLAKLVFTWILTGLAALDAERFWLPDVVTLPSVFLGILITLIRGDSLLAAGSIARPVTLRLLDVAFSIFVSGALILLIRWIYKLIRHREGIGLGDAKLMAMLGAWLGLPGALLSFAIGVSLGSFYALLILAVPAARRSSQSWAATKLPLGTFLCIGGIISALWGQPIIAAYMRWVGL